LEDYRHFHFIYRSTVAIINLRLNDCEGVANIFYCIDKILALATIFGGIIQYLDEIKFYEMGIISSLVYSSFLHRHNEVKPIQNTHRRFMMGVWWSPSLVYSQASAPGKLAIFWHYGLQWETPSFSLFFHI
jgi:hypothetical protein